MLGEGRNKVLSKKEAKEAGKSYENRVTFGQLINSGLTTDKNLKIVSDSIVKLREDKDKNSSNLETLTQSITKLFILNVRCQPGRKLKKFEQVLRKLEIYKVWDSSTLNQINLYERYRTILADFFHQNLKIQAYEDLNLNLDQANEIFNKLDFLK